MLLLVAVDAFDFDVFRTALFHASLVSGDLLHVVYGYHFVLRCMRPSMFGLRLCFLSICFLLLILAVLCFLRIIDSLAFSTLPSFGFR